MKIVGHSRNNFGRHRVEFKRLVDKATDFLATDFTDCTDGKGGLSRRGSPAPPQSTQARGQVGNLR